MHQLLRPKFPAKLAGLSGALWCAWMIAAVLGHGSQNNAPAPAAAGPPPPIAIMVRTVRIAPELAFDDRWQAPAPAMQQARIADEGPIGPLKAEQNHESTRHAARHADPVCGSRGRRYFHICRRLSIGGAGDDERDSSARRSAPAALDGLGLPELLRRAPLGGRPRRKVARARSSRSASTTPSRPTSTARSRR
jgi:hypothetical protein